MGKHLRVLNIEDSAEDAELIHRHLSRAGYDVISERVDTPDAMKSSLKGKDWDVILCDYSMPKFDALSALALLHESDLDIPFIIISGAIGEEVAVQATLAGANDYLMKGNLTRLVPSIERELAEVGSRQARRRAEEALKASEAELRALFAAMTDVIVVFDRDGRFLKVASSSFAVPDGSADDLIGKSVKEIFSPDAAAFFLKHISLALEQGGVHRVEYRMEDDGESVWFDGKVSPLSDDSVLWIGRDISERKSAEEALRISEERFRAVFESTTDCILVVDSEYSYLYANQAAIDHVGMTADKFVGRTMFDALSHLPDFLQLWMDRVDEAIATGRVFRVEDTSLIGSREVWSESVISPLRNDSGEVYAVAVVYRDITERRHLEEQLRQSQKMEAIGLLAGGVAHDFNNLLTAIGGYSELTLRRLREDDPLRTNVEEIKRAGERAASLTGQLLAFSRRQVLQPKVLDLNAVVGGVEKMLRRLIGADIDLVTDLDASLGTVSADPGQIEQVIMNLAVNARDAMPHGGTLTIHTANVHRSSQQTDPRPAYSHVVLSVADTGTGIDEEKRERIFEPFFTTKEAGKGTGLGLSTVYGIVAQSDGEVEVSSEPGKGATFSVYLPCVADKPSEVEHPQHITEDLHGSETVLLAEDEDMVRKLANDVLVSYGYRVLGAESGDTALAVCERHKEPIDVLLTDIVMRGMSGPELANRVRKKRPDIKVIYMSGYTDDTPFQRGAADEQTPFIAKPFAPDELARKVREVLER